MVCCWQSDLLHCRVIPTRDSPHLHSTRRSLFCSSPTWYTISDSKSRLYPSASFCVFTVIHLDPVVWLDAIHCWSSASPTRFYSSVSSRSTFFHCFPHVRSLSLPRRSCLLYFLNFGYALIRPQAAFLSVRLSLILIFADSNWLVRTTSNDHVDCRSKSAGHGRDLRHEWGRDRYGRDRCSYQ